MRKKRGSEYNSEWSLCVALISFHELYLFRSSEATCFVSIYKHESWYEEKKIHPCGGQLLFSWGKSNASWIEGAISIFTNVFERKTSIKMASPPHLFHFLSSSLLEYSWRSLARRNVWVSISNRALVSIKSPGVSPKIHTFCQSLGRDSGWNRAEARVRKRCLRLPVAQSLGVQWQPGFLLRSTLAFPGAEKLVIVWIYRRGDVGRRPQLVNWQSNWILPQHLTFLLVT